MATANTDSVAAQADLRYLVFGSYTGGSGGVEPAGTFSFLQWTTIAGFGSGYSEIFLGHSTSIEDAIGGYTSAVAYDTTHYVRTYVVDNYTGSDAGGEFASKSNAQAALADTPTSSAVLSTTATIACDYTPNVVSSSCSAQLQYKKASDGTWTDAGSPQTTGGGSEIPVSRNITGLVASTQYNIRLVISRTTNNLTSLTSATASFTTLAGEPTIVTDDAGGVTAVSATLNATLDINEGTSVTVYWKWGTDNPPTQNTTTPQAASADGSFDESISGLSASITYYHQAFVAFATPAGSPNNGDVKSFETPVDPLADAAEEDHMQTFEFNERKYGVSSTFYFTVASPAATSSDRFFNAASPFVAGDVQLSKDGAGFSNVGTLPTRVGSTAVFALDLDNTEMQFVTGVVQIVDQNGPAFRDAVLVIRTKFEVANMDIDASQKSNTTAFLCTGVGSGHGASFVGGATGLDIDGILGQHVLRSGLAQSGGASVITLDASANATNDYYNGSIILIVGGTGVGQARVITDYTGASREATVDTSWTTNPAVGSVFSIVGGSRTWELGPAAELAGIPAATGNFGLKLQSLFQRFFFKRTQTVTTQTLFKADNSTSIGTASVSDDGATQTSGKLS